MIVQNKMQKIRRSSSLTLTPLLDEFAVLHHPTGNYFRLNPTGAAILKFCSAPKNRDEIAAFLASEFNADKQAVQKDIAAFLEQLIREGLLETDPK